MAVNSFNFITEKGTDTHTLPGEGNIQWDRFSEVLSAIPYTGNLSLEVQTDNSRFKDPVLFLKEAMRGVEQMIRIIQNSWRSKLMRVGLIQ